jgi:hypothetical protein
MNYAEVVKRAQETVRAGTARAPFAECKLWEKGDKINL